MAWVYARYILVRGRLLDFIDRHLHFFVPDLSPVALAQRGSDKRFVSWTGPIIHEISDLVKGGRHYQKRSL